MEGMQRMSGGKAPERKGWSIKLVWWEGSTYKERNGDEASKGGGAGCGRPVGFSGAARDNSWREPVQQQCTSQRRGGWILELKDKAII